MEQCGFTELPSEFGGLVGVSTLTLADNNLTAIPPEISALTMLTSLSLKANNFETFPSELCAATALTALFEIYGVLCVYYDWIFLETTLPQFPLKSQAWLLCIPCLKLVMMVMIVNFCLLQNNKIETIPAEMSVLTMLNRLF